MLVTTHRVTLTREKKKRNVSEKKLPIWRFSFGVLGDTVRGVPTLLSVVSGVYRASCSSNMMYRGTRCTGMMSISRIFNPLMPSWKIS